MLLITFEGIDGCGKTTASKKLGDILRDAGFDAAWSREPTYEQHGQEMRRLAKARELTPEKELELFLADRAEHVKTFTHEIELVDRYYHSTMAYQGARGMDMAELEHLNTEEHKFPVPDLTLIFDVDVKIGLGRSAKSGEAIETHFEEAKFLEKVRVNYQQIWDTRDQWKGEIRFINAEVSLEGMMDDVFDIINSFLLSKAVEMDRAAESRFDVRRFYQKLINFGVKRKKHDIDVWRHYLCFLIIIADDTMFGEEWRELLHRVHPWKDGEELVADYPRLHVPVVMHYIKRARLKEARKITDHMAGDGPWRHRLESYISTLEHVKRHNFAVFPLFLDYTEWWHGPHLIKFKWFPCKVVELDEEKKFILCQVALTDKMDITSHFLGEQSGDWNDPWLNPEYGMLELTVEKWKRYCGASGKTPPQPEPGMFFELYEFGEDDCRIEVHEVPADWPPDWMDTELSTDRYLKVWSEQERGKRFSSTGPGN